MTNEEFEALKKRVEDLESIGRREDILGTVAKKADAKHCG